MSRHKKVGYHNTISLRIDSASLVVFKEVSSNSTSGPKSAPDDQFFFSLVKRPLFNYFSIFGTPNATILIIYVSMRGKCASTLKKLLLEKSPFIVQEPNRRMYGVVYGQPVSVVL